MDEVFESILSVVSEDKQEEVKAKFEEIKDSTKITGDTWKVFAKDPLNRPIVGDLFKEVAGDTAYESYINPIFDARVSKAATKAKETFMEKEFPNLLNDEITKRFPSKTPLELEMAELKDELAKERADAKRKDQCNLAIKLSEGMYEGFEPERYIGETDEDTTANVAKAKENYIKALEAKAKEVDNIWLAKTGGQPETGEDSENIPNPFLEGDNFSLTVQTKLFRENKKLYDRYMREAENLTN